MLLSVLGGAPADAGQAQDGRAEAGAARTLDRPAARRLRIVSLVPALTETLFAVDAGSAVIAVSTYCNYPPAAAALPKVGSFLQPSVEAIVAAEPDLVVTSPSPGNRNAVEALRRTGLRVEVLGEGSASIADAEATIVGLAELVGRAAEGRRVVGRIEQALAELRRRTAGRRRPAVAVIVGVEPLVLAGPQSYLGDLVTAAGGRNVAESIGGKWPRTSAEFLLSSAPEVIIDASMESAASATVGRRWQRYASLPAVSAGRVYAAGSDLFLRPGPRLAEAARILARWIQPQAWREAPSREAD